MRELGEACSIDANGPFACHFYLACGGDQICHLPPKDLSCDGTTSCPIIYSNFYYCNVGAKMCVPDPLGSAGQDCGPNVGLCQPQLSCTKRSNESGYYCTPRIADGQPCNGLDHPFDNFTAAGGGCQHGTCWQGTCQSHDALECHP